MIKVYSADSAVDAQLVCDMLLASGIDARVHGDYLTGASGELPVSSIVSVWIDLEKDRQKARQIIDLMEEDRRASVIAFNCSECGSEVASNFSNCWSCGSRISP